MTTSGIAAGFSHQHLRAGDVRYQFDHGLAAAHKRALRNPALFAPDAVPYIPLMFQDFLRRLTAPDPEPLTDTDARLALAALLVRIARTDGDYAQIEIDRIDRVLATRYGLSPFEVAKLRGEAEVLEIGVDARPAFPDNLPRIRRRGNVIYANGLFRHGYLLAPAVARMTADYLFDGNRPEVMDEDRD